MMLLRLRHLRRQPDIVGDKEFELSAILVIASCRQPDIVGDKVITFIQPSLFFLVDSPI